MSGAVLLAGVAGLLLGGAIALWRGRRSRPYAVALVVAAFMALWAATQWLEAQP